jgi:hypothetical protein
VLYARRDLQYPLAGNIKQNTVRTNVKAKIFAKESDICACNASHIFHDGLAITKNMSTPISSVLKNAITIIRKSTLPIPVAYLLICMNGKNGLCEF